MVVPSYQNCVYTSHFSTWLVDHIWIYFSLLVFCSLLFCLLWKTIKAINNCAELQITWPNAKKQQIECACGFTSISTNHALNEGVAVLDGYHLQTITPLKKEVHNVQSYFSSHYQTYGVNIQAACNHNCQFLFIGITGPGIMGDRQAVVECGLSKLVESTSRLLYCIGNCAYTLTVEMVFLSQKTLTFLQKRQYCKTLQQNLMEKIWCMTLQHHIPITENGLLVMELETYGYTRKGGMGS